MDVASRELKQEFIIEKCFLLVFCVAYITFTIVHEPWFDESQSWQIARCATLQEILFEIPHYEGHPQLWHLLLVPLAKMGIPFEIGLKTIGFIITTTVTYIILFKSPFPRFVRLLLPFNYFLFYQYGIIVRPYMLLILMLLVLAIMFPSKDVKPFRFSCVLCLLCCIHAYGMAIAAGIAIGYVIDIWLEKRTERFIKEIFSDVRMRCMLMLLIAAILIILCIVPYADIDNPGIESTTPIWIRLSFSIIALPSESLVVTSQWLSDDRALLQTTSAPMISLIASFAIGIIIWMIVYLLSSKRSFKYFYLPYCAYAILGGSLYMAAHHVGVSLGILVFWMWTNINDENRLERWQMLCSRLKATQRDVALAKTLLYVFFLSALFIPIWWTISSCWKDFNDEYDSSRYLAAMFKRTGLDQGVVFNAWISGSEGEGASEGEGDSIGAEQKTNTCMFGDVSTLQAYYDKKIIANVDKGYLEYRVASEEENQLNRIRWRSYGIPDVLIGDVDLEWVFGDDVSIDEYGLVFLAKSNHIWKGIDNRATVPVYLRKSLFDEYGVQEIILTPEESRILTGEVKLTEEILESIRTGDMSIEEYLDELGL